MGLKSGTMDKFDADSMAAAMENAFQIEWNKLRDEGIVKADLPDSMKVYWQVFFVAVAQGVVRHLKENARDAFQIHVRVTQTNEVLMQSDNPNIIPTTGINWVQQGVADVSQLDEGSNMVISEGHGEIVEVLTDE